VVQNSAEFAIEKALEQDAAIDNLTWGMFVENGVFGGEMKIEKIEDNPASLIANEIMAILEDELEGAIAEELEKLTPEQIAKVMDPEFIEELAEEAIEEIIEEIEELFEEGSNDDDDDDEADNDSDEEEEADTAEPVDAKTALLGTIGTANAKDKNDLKKIKGIGPKLEGVLNEMGIYTYAQVSKMTEKEYDLVDSLLTAFKGRGKRDDWAGQAKSL
jgi:predicted flap endonuclease-1-like 5' DNA nuclease